MLNHAIQTAEANAHHRWLTLFRLYAAWLHLEAGNPIQAQTICRRVRSETNDHRFPFGELMSGVLYGRSLQGLDRTDEALAWFDQQVAKLDQNRMFMDWIWRMPLPLGRGECRQVLGQRSGTIADAELVCRLASGPGERT